MKAAWQRKRLAEVCTLQRGFDLPTKDRNAGSVPLVSSSGVVDHIDHAKVTGPGVVTGRSGSIGNVFYVEDDFWPLNTALYVKNFFGNDQRFVFLLLRSLDLNRFASGTGVPTLNRNHVSDEIVLVPECIEEQRRMVAMLDDAFAAIATATLNAKANVASARELLDGFLSSAFNRTNNGWHTTTIGESCTLRSGTTVRADLERPSGDLPYLKVADMSQPGNMNEVTTSSRFLQRSDVGRNAVIPEGATIFPKRGGAIMTNKKRLTATEIAADLNIMAVIPGAGLNPRFLNYYFQNVDMRLLGSGSSIPQINNYDIEPLKIAIPDASTQIAFVEKADNLKVAVTDLADTYRRKRISLSELERCLLHRAFTGELSAIKFESIGA